MRNLRLLFLLIPATIGLAFITSAMTFPSRPEVKCVVPNIDRLKSGDIIFRHGKGIISDFFARLSEKDHRYSHAGIIHIENNIVYVYHLTGGDSHLPDKIKK